MSCLLLAAYGVYFRSTVSVYQRAFKLEESIFPLLKPWEAHRSLPLSDKIIEALELDDYVNRSFSNGRDAVSLYIGFYGTQKKVGAAHSPLVCLPGQGWNLSAFANQNIQAGGNTLNLASMVIGKDEEQQLLLYWFQAYNRTSPGTFMQKVNLLRAKFLYAREDNAFVRVVIPFGRDRTKKEAENIGVQFIQDFYPAFLNYVTK